jgi:hypothetical protein
MLRRDTPFIQKTALIGDPAEKKILCRRSDMMADFFVDRVIFQLHIRALDPESVLIH